MLLNLYSSLLAFDRKLEGFTISKCAFKRNMETCILEQLYFTNRKRAIIQSVKLCQDSSCSYSGKQDPDQKCLEACVRNGESQSEELKAQITAMIETTKRELA